jgi:hypothetical protein
VLLSKKSHAIDHLDRSFACRLQALVESGVLTLEELYSLGGDDAFDSSALEGLQTCFSLESPATERRQLVPEMFDQLFQLRESGPFRSYAV